MQAHFYVGWVFFFLNTLENFLEMCDNLGRLADELSSLEMPESLRKT